MEEFITRLRIANDVDAANIIREIIAMALMDTRFVERMMAEPKE